MTDQHSSTGTESALDFYIKDWERIIYDAFLDQERVDRLMELAQLNGMFDPIRIERASVKPPCIPQNPEFDGYHWVRRYRGGPAIPLFWNALWHANANRGWGDWAEPHRENEWEYLGPCPSPDDARAALSQVRP